MMNLILIGYMIGSILGIEAGGSGDAAAREFTFQSVNQVSLYDEQGSVIRKLGEPLTKEQDEYDSGMERYGYSGMNVFFLDGVVESVEVPVSAGTVRIDDAIIPLTAQDIAEALGEPDYVAEDGIVFERNEFLVKLFLEEGTGRLTSLTYFHKTSI